MQDINIIEKRMRILDEKLNIAMKWLQNNNKGKSLFWHLREQGIDKIIVYGASEFAVRFLEEAEKENYRILGIVDKRIISPTFFYQKIPLLSLEDLSLEKYKNEYVVITAMGYYEEIRCELQKKGIEKVISLREVIENNFLNTETNY